MSDAGIDPARRRLLSFVPGVAAALVEAGAGAGTVQTRAAAVLSADITGFTALADQLAEPGAGGGEALQRELNRVLAPTVALIVARGGDVVGFAGDSVLALFHPSADRNRCLAAARDAAETVLAQARNAGLGLRVGVAAGPVSVALLGDEARAHVVCLGDTVVDAIETQLAGTLGSVHVGPVRAGRDRTDRSAAAALPMTAFLPARRGEQVQTGRALLMAERRTVTSVFATLPALLCRPEYCADLQREVVAALAVVRAWDGDLRQVETGPAGPVLVCAFGATRAGVDDETRAVACARDLLEACSVRAVGVATGPVFCGELGATTRRDVAVVGGSVNLAARLMTMAADGEILIDQATHDAQTQGTGPAPTAPTPRQLTVRGFSRPLRTWRVLPEPRAVQPGRPAALLGRDVELTRLLDAVDRITMAVQGNPLREDAVQILRGPAGIGKSALAAAALHARPDHLGLSVRFTARETGWPAWGPCVRTLLDLGAAAATGSVDAALRRLGVARVDGQLELLRPLLGLPVDQDGLGRSFDVRGRNELVAAFLGEILRARCRQRPAVLLIEDAQFAGPELDPVLRALQPSGSGPPVLVLERVEPGEPARPAIGSVLELGPLDDAAAAAVARSQLPASSKPVPEAVVRRVVEFGGGNPLQLQQLALHLGAPGELDAPADGEVPRGLTRVLRARLDRLPPSALEVAAVASVVDDAISAELLAAAHPALGPVRAVRHELGRLVDLRILEPGAFAEYRFGHASVRAVAYAGLGARARQDLHAAVGHQLARRARALPGGETTVALPDLEAIAWHFLHSRDTQASRHWLSRAGQAARDAWSVPSASRWYEGLIPIVDEPERTSARLALAELQFMSGNWTMARTNYEQVMEQAETGSATRAEAAHGLGVLAIRTSTVPVAIDLLTEAVDGWAALDRPDRLLMSLDRLTFAHHVAGTARPALETAARLLSVADALGDPAARADALETAALAAWTAGDLDLAGRRLVAALELARSAGNLRCLVHGLSDLAGVRLDQGDDAAALAGLTEADAVAERIGYRRAQVSLRANRGEVLRRRGDLDAARHQLHSALSSVLDLGDVYVATSVVGNLGLVEAAAEQPERARPVLTLAVRAARAGGQDALRREFEAALDGLTGVRADQPVLARTDPELAGLLDRMLALVSSVHGSL